MLQPLLPRIARTFTLALSPMSLSQRLFGNAFEAARLLGDRRWDIAIGVFSALAKVLPNASWVQRDQGRAYSGKGLWDQAEAACRRAVELAPEDPWCYQALAECYVNQARWSEALPACETAIRLDPHDPWLRHLKSRVHLGQEDCEAAIAELEFALKQDDNVSWFQHQMGEALVRMGQTEAAIPYLKRAIKLNPGFPWSHYNLGLALLSRDDFAGAIASFQAAEACGPDDAAMFQNYQAYVQHIQAQEQHLQDYCQARIKAKADSPETRDRPLDVLLVTPYPTYPPKLGAITRMFQSARGLGKHHRLVVASIIFEPQGFDIVTAMEDYCDLSIVALVGDPTSEAADKPNLIRKYSSQRLERMLKQLSEVDFDIVCFDFVYMAQYRSLFPQAFTVICEHNIESDLLQRFTDLQAQQEGSQAELEKLKRTTAGLAAFDQAESQAQKLAAYEIEHWPQFDLRTVVSTNDRDILLSRCPDYETWVVNNGIDTEATPLLSNQQARKLFFFGTLTYFPNIDGATYFAQEVMPLIWEQAPEMQLCIAGANPAETVMALAQDPRIEVVASPDVMEAVAQDCHISVVPLRVGSGTRIKILHAMAMGLPVVSTSLGCEGLEGEDGKHLLVHDEPEQMARAVLALDGDRELWQKLRHNGRQLVEEQYDWQAIYADFETKLFAHWQEQRDR